MLPHLGTCGACFKQRSHALVIETHGVHCSVWRRLAANHPRALGSKRERRCSSHVTAGDHVESEERRPRHESCTDNNHPGPL
jgi:hypothetical protein